MEKEKKSLLTRLWQHILRRIITGVVIIVPAGLTYIILKWFFRGEDGILSPYVSFLVKKYMPYLYELIKVNIGVYQDGEIPALGFFLVITAVYLIGLFSTNVLGKSIIQFLNNLLMRTPVVSWIYKTIKQLVDTITGTQREAFQKVVLVDIMKSGTGILGFVTGHSVGKEGQKYTQVFVPTAPNPTSGYLIFLKSDQIVETKLSIEEAIKTILSGGVITPEKIN